VVSPYLTTAPPSLIDFVLSRNLADGVAVAGCAESACYNRLGVVWTEQRFAGMRDPYLRARVPRERLATIWASALAVKKADAEIAAFAERLAKLPPRPLRSPLAPSTVSHPPAREPADLGGET
jgi:coenzyme F420-reducing hydrogenase delta subunit